MGPFELECIDGDDERLMIRGDGDHVAICHERDGATRALGWYRSRDLQIILNALRPSPPRRRRKSLGQWLTDHVLGRVDVEREGEYDCPVAHR